MTLTFGQTVRKARKKRGLLLKHMAELMEVSIPYLSDIENGNRKPKADEIINKLAITLDINEDWLYYLAGRFPLDITQKNLSYREFQEAMTAFRRSLE